MVSSRAGPAEKRISSCEKHLSHRPRDNDNRGEGLAIGCRVFVR